MSTSINGMVLPERVINKLNEASGYFGDSFKDMVLHAIEENTKSIKKDSLKVLEESIKRSSDKRAAIEENEITILKHFKDGKMIFESNFYNEDIGPKSFIDKLKIARPDYMSHFSILREEEEPQEPAPSPEASSKHGAIEGDGEEVTDDTVDTDQAAEANPTNPADPNNPNNPEEPQEPEMDDEQKLQLELAQTDSKFVTVVLYDKIVELLGSIRTIKENMSASKTETELDMYLTLEKYESYLEILNELIFVMDLNTIYYNVVNITIEVNDLLNKYLISTKVKVLNDKNSSNEEKDKATEDLKINNNNSEDTNEEIDDMGDEVQ